MHFASLFLFLSCNFLFNEKKTIMGFRLKYYIIIFIFCLLSFIIFFDIDSPSIYLIGSITMSSIPVRCGQELFYVYKINFIARKNQNDSELGYLDIFCKIHSYLDDIKNHKGYVSVCINSSESVDYLFVFSKNPLKAVTVSFSSRPIAGKLIRYKVFSRQYHDEWNKGGTATTMFRIEGKKFTCHSLNSEATKDQHKWVVNYIKRNFQES